MKAREGERQRCGGGEYPHNKEPFASMPREEKKTMVITICIEMEHFVWVFHSIDENRFARIFDYKL